MVWRNKKIPFISFRGGPREEKRAALRTSTRERLKRSEKERGLSSGRRRSETIGEE